MEIKKADILGVPCSVVTYDRVLARVKELVDSGRQAYFTTPNPEILVLAQENPGYLRALQGSDIAIPDGVGILWAATYLRSWAPRFWPFRILHLLWSLALLFLWPARYRVVFPERVTGTDLMFRVAERAVQEGWKIFLLGARGGAGEIAADNLRLRYPGVNIVGTYAGSPAADEEREIAERINQASPDILFVAYGNPAQEIWIHRNLHGLYTVNVAVGIGGALDFAAGKVRRAPERIRRIGMEWLWRLVREPRRLRRIWRATFVFIRLIMRKRFT